MEALLPLLGEAAFIAVLALLVVRFRLFSLPQPGDVYYAFDDGIRRIIYSDQKGKYLYQTLNGSDLRSEMWQTTKVIWGQRDVEQFIEKEKQRLADVREVCEKRRL